MFASRRLRAPIVLLAAFAPFLTLTTKPASAAWTQTSGPRGGLIRAIASVPDGSGGSRLFAGQIGVWRTEDNGSSWTHHANGLIEPSAMALLAVPDGSGGHGLLVGTSGGVFRSTDQGASWGPINNGIPHASIYALAHGPNGSGGSNLYAGGYLGAAFRSIDNGASWTSMNGLPADYHIYAMMTSPAGTVLSASGNGIHRSTNHGATWTRVFTLAGLSLARHASTLYAGTSNGVYRSTDDGATWTPINSGMGFTWVQSVAAIPNGSGGVTLFAGAGLVLRSVDNGATWTTASDGLTSYRVYALTAVPNGSGGTQLYAGTADGIFRSTNHGDSWTNVSFVYSQVQALDVTPAGTVLASSENDIFRSVDLGNTWIDTQSTTTALDFAINPLAPGGTTLFAGNSPAGIHKSTDDGATWQGSSNGLDDFDVNSMAAVPNGAGGMNILAGTYSGTFISTNNGGFWQDAHLETLPLDFIVTPDGAGGHRIYGGGFGGVWVSTNHGTAWTPVNTALTDKIVQALAATGQGASLFAGGDPFGVFRSTDNGSTWTAVNAGLTDPRIYALLSPDGTNLFAGGAGGVYLSTDNGAGWTSVGEGLTTGVYALAQSADGSTLLAGTTGFGVWKRPLDEMLARTGVPSDPAPVVSRLANYPNPFKAGTRIRFSLSHPTPVRLVVHDVSGRLVRTLVDGFMDAGEGDVAWDGRDDRGVPVRSGIYVYRLEADGIPRTGKMQLLR